jgi:Flp pilus assembly protein TadD
MVASGLTYLRATAPKETLRLAMDPIEVLSPDVGAVASEMMPKVASQLARLKGGNTARFVFVSNKTDGDGLTHILHATVSKRDKYLSVHAALSDAHQNLRLRDWNATYDPGQERYIPVALAGMVTASLKLPAFSIASVKSSAAKDYADGVQFTRQNSTLDQAVDSLERAVNLDPDSPLTHAALAEAEWFKYFGTRDSKWRDALKISLAEAEKRDLDVAAAHRVEGYLRYNDGLYEQAASEFRRAVDLEPDTAIGHIWLGKSYEDNNQLDDALKAYQKAVQVEPNYFKPYQNLGAFYMNRSNFREGAKYEQMAVDRAPNEPSLHSNLAAAFMQMGDFGKAEQELNKSIALQETPFADYNLGLTLMYENKDPEAAGYLQKALNFQAEPPGGKPLVLMHLGIAYRRLHQNEAARQVNTQGLQLAKTMMEHNPRDGYVNSYLGYFNATLGNRAVAESEIIRALGLSPDDSGTRWRAALTYEELYRQFGDPALRDKTLEVLMRFAPEDLDDLSRWPDVADLQKSPRFVSLLAARRTN